MKIDIYKSVRNGSKYLSVPAGTDVAGTPFPSTLDPDLHKLSPFKTSFDIQPGESRVGLNSDDIIRQITEQKFATHSTTVTVTVSILQPK